ncbi:OsmC-like protein [Artomyces pyxidatus]|uniref:OsmC-like protein n=1 Tax=Artomyces pyxidatus TaxID=48021 RepID=A0ACB8TCZ3_9AGAM|nr:OsmC-like protein [Artomyces pyxidatus]
MTIQKPQYTAHATARGKGRDGQVSSDDDSGLQLRLATPKSLGGQGDGQNPEQLFAMAYAGCFLTALQLAAGRMGKVKEARNAVVHANVHMGQATEMDDLGVAVDILVEGIADQALIDAGHEMCPYSRALKHGAVVNVSKA